MGNPACKAADRSLSDENNRLLARIVVKRPRVHCLTNPVAQGLTAQALVAIGVEPSMSAHPEEIVALASRSDAILVNLGMLDPMREAAIEMLLTLNGGFEMPLVLDPVMVERSPFRRSIAERFGDFPKLIVKGNRSEMTELANIFPAGTTLVTTGPVDLVSRNGFERSIDGGHPLLAQVSGTGCLAGAMIAAFAAVEPDPLRASTSALQVLRAATASAGALARGPGTFVPLMLDALANAAQCQILNRIEADQ
ncbi:Hydroxyethylthiazole kinase [Rhabdaerophilaceae bacterium]